MVAMGRRRSSAGFVCWLVNYLSRVLLSSRAAQDLDNFSKLIIFTNSFADSLPLQLPHDPQFRSPEVGIVGLRIWGSRRRLKGLNYPGNLTKSNFAAMGSLHSWPDCRDKRGLQGQWDRSPLVSPQSSQGIQVGSQVILIQKSWNEIFKFS